MQDMRGASLWLRLLLVGAAPVLAAEAWFVWPVSRLGAGSLALTAALWLAAGLFASPKGWAMFAVWWALAWLAALLPFVPWAVFYLTPFALLPFVRFFFLQGTAGRAVAEGLLFAAIWFFGAPGLFVLASLSGETDWHALADSLLPPSP